MLGYLSQLSMVAKLITLFHKELFCHLTMVAKLITFLCKELFSPPLEQWSNAFASVLVGCMVLRSVD